MLPNLIASSLKNLSSSVETPVRLFNDESDFSNSTDVSTAYFKAAPTDKVTPAKPAKPTAKLFTDPAT